MNQSRLLATRALVQIIGKGRSLNHVLPELFQVASVEDRAFTQELVYGVLRWHPRLQFFLSELLSKPFKAKDMDITCALLIGVYQLEFMRLPPYAAINETVDLAEALKKKWAAGVINAILRNYQRQRDNLQAKMVNDLEATTAHPAWLAARVMADWPHDWERVLQENNKHAPMALRVNLRHQSRDVYLQQLQAAKIEAHVVSHTEAGIELERAQAVENLPGFAEGDVSVQDGAAQIAAQLLDVQSGDYVLDACAAPGGKTAAVLERQPDIRKMVAMDISETRLRQVTETLDRLGLHAECKPGDASEVDNILSGRLFDRILLDVPCSGTGVIRRNPDIKIHRKPDDIAALTDKQKRILNAAWQVLKPGGVILYSTCSIIRDENDLQVAQFLATHKDAEEFTIDEQWGRAVRVGRQILPGEHHMDGFYYARLRKK